jgi:hypothetical protein
MHNSKPVPAPHDRLASATARVDYPAYVSKAAELANRLSQLRIDRTLRAPGADSPEVSGLDGRLNGRRLRPAGRPARKARALSAAGKARVDLQIKMLGAIPAKARDAFVKELADHARKYPSSARYFRSLADLGNDAARAVVARMGGER